MRTRLLSVLVAAIAAAAGCGNGCEPSRGRDARTVTSSRAGPSPSEPESAPSPEQLEQARRLMAAFADRTGLSSQRPQRRYLWTDAFAVRNFLGLERVTGDAHYRELALRLVDRVHHTLGQHRPDDSRKGWLSGLSGAEAEAHPTRGGLRIGKDLKERTRDQPFDEELEWDRDGQYFHYLTQWMGALDAVARVTHKPEFNAWARELADTAYRAFSYPASRRRRMFWKMSIDLSHPLVPSMGQHDALDGYVVCRELEATRSTLPGAPDAPNLSEATRDFNSMIDREALYTSDPLGLGALLIDAYRLDALSADGSLQNDILRAALDGLVQFERHGELDDPADQRLAFRELGLAIGLEAVTRLRSVVGGTKPPEDGDKERNRLIESLLRHDRVRDQIISFWAAPEHQKPRSFTEHLDINEVMLATALAPQGLLSR